MKMTVYNQVHKDPNMLQHSRKKTEWLVPAALLLLGTVPLIAGAFRLIELAGGAEMLPANPHLMASPFPVVMHILSVSIFTILGAFQFTTGFRQRRPRWHRISGRILVPLGLLAGLSGLWLTLFIPHSGSLGGELLYALRILFGTAMTVSVVLGFTAIRRMYISKHRAWMIRAYAIGLGAGTQVFTNLAWVLINGQPSEFINSLLMGTGWVINIAVAEWIIRK